MQDEILKHTKKIYMSAKDSKHTLVEKFTEILTELFIIIFAVTLSIWFHSWSEHRHEQKEVKSFLKGLKQDLTKDMANLQSYKKEADTSRLQLSFLFNITKNQYDSLQINHIDLQIGENFYSTAFNNGRYEGFKTSGKLNTIENEDLRNNILAYYQQRTHMIATAESLTNGQQLKFIDYLVDNEVKDRYLEFFTKKKTRMLIITIINTTKKTASEYEAAINEVKGIIADIDKESVE